MNDETTPPGGAARDGARSMDCGRLREVLVEHVDGLLGAAEAEGARAHLAACAPCRNLQEEVRRNFAAMDAWEEEELPAGAFARLEARIARAPAPAASAAASAAAVPARRSWIRLAVPYAAGLATAAAAAFVLLMADGTAPPLPPEGGGGPAAPLASPGVRTVRPVVHGGMAEASTGSAAPAVPGAPAAEAADAAADAAAGGAAADLRPGERKLRFEDSEGGVVRTILLPPDVDPREVMFVESPARTVPGPEVR